jgi:hypothetical protein
MTTRARRSARTAAVLASAVTIAVAVGCGGSGGKKAKPLPVTDGRHSAPHLHAGPARPRDVAVIRGWADTLRAGRVGAAARYFAVPALVANGSPELGLPTEAAVRLFNASLPCGATLLDARRVGSYTIAIFRLTERPGGGCGPGTGHEAATAFRFRAGKITEWRRVAVPAFDPGPRSRPPSSRQV